MKAKYHFITLSLSLATWATAVLAADPVNAANTPVTVIPQTQDADKSASRISIQDLKNMRDPFKKPTLEGPGWQEEKPKSELERVPLSELTMVGVLTGPYKTRALLRTPGGAVFPVTDGTKVGVQNGYIRKVFSDRIIVNEVVQDLLGEQEVVTTELKLNSKGVEKGVSNVRPISSLPSMNTETYGGGGSTSGPLWNTPNSGAKTQTQQKPSGANQGFTINLPPPVAAPKVGMDNVQLSQPPTPGH